MTGTLREFRVLVVLAHPDDETLACGGTLARLASAGAHVGLVCATRGEAARISASDEVDTLAHVRPRELARACGHLGVADVEVLDFPDGMLEWSGANALIDAVADRLRTLRPDAVVTFGRDGLYWHPDHIAVGERVRAAVARCAAEGLYVAAYGVVMPPGAVERVVARVRAAFPSLMDGPWGLSPAAFGKGAVRASRIVDVSGVLHQKLAALRCHASQLSSDNPMAHLTPERAQPLAVEHFHLLETSPLHHSAFDDIAGR